jgi:8-oxo-dGTP pyrophosphatase MutT (NUDIX family)
MQESQFEGAGFIFLTTSNKVLLLQKPNKNWTFPGGHAELYEEPKETAMRECMEEIGVIPKGEILGYFKYIKPDTKGKCFSFLMKIKKEFIPILSSEHIDYRWIQIAELKKIKLSKSVRQAIAELFKYLKGR